MPPWGWPWPVDSVGAACGCCGGGGGQTLIVLAHDRYDPGSGYRTITAYDQDGNIRWFYDLGTHPNNSAGTGTGTTYDTTAAIIPQKVVIDSSGNSYIPWAAYDIYGIFIEDGSGIGIQFGIIKLDINGNLVWNYTHSDHTISFGFSSPGPNLDLLQGVTLDNSENPIFSMMDNSDSDRFSPPRANPYGEVNNTNFLWKIDKTTGTLLQAYSSTSIGTSVFDSYSSLGASALAVDASDRILWSPNPSTPSGLIERIDGTTGAFVDRNALSAGAVWCGHMLVDLASNSVMTSTIENRGGNGAPTGIFAAEFSLTDLSAIWQRPFSDFGAVTRFRPNSTCIGLGASSSNFFVPTELLRIGAVAASQYSAIDRDGTAPWITWANYDSPPSTMIFTGTAYDKTNDVLIAVQATVLNSPVIYRLSSTTGAVMWSTGARPFASNGQPTGLAIHAF